ncbi:hypothetical protein [Nakamurella lactea]|nr:hypothetical protein [Nakamurella lactea]
MTHAPRWEPPRPIGTRWERVVGSVRLIASVAGIVGGRTTTRTPRH